MGAIGEDLGRSLWVLGPDFLHLLQGEKIHQAIAITPDRLGSRLVKAVVKIGIENEGFTSLDTWVEPPSLS